MRLILGTTSPRRREIFEYFTLPFEQISPHFAEEEVSFSGDPREYANTLSRGKGASIAKSHPHALIITADTVVYKEGKIYNKPLSTEENISMLKELSGRWHSVFTSISGRLEKKEITICEETKVLFNTLVEDEIKEYCRVFKPLDKAGGYAIQEGGAVLVNRIEGCFYNVMGLSINGLITVLKAFNIPLWRYLKHPSTL